jgi:propanol-preferring alcohol dehydrogenase
MVLDQPGRALREAELPEPQPGPGQVLLRVRACGVCRTDLHVADGELPDAKLPLVLATRSSARTSSPASGSACRGSAGPDGECRYCASGRENLCDNARFTGYQLDGGYAEYAVADRRYCFPIPDGYADVQAAPLLCAGLIGYRSLRLAGDASRIGLYGFGASAHIVAQVARAEGRRVFAFTRRDD